MTGTGRPTKYKYALLHRDQKAQLYPSGDVSASYRCGGINAKSSEPQHQEISEHAGT